MNDFMLQEWGADRRNPVAVFGSGLITCGLAARALRENFRVKLVARSASSAERAKATILGWFAGEVGKDNLPDSRELVARRNLIVLNGYDDMGPDGKGLSDCLDMGVEAIIEEIDPKHAEWKQIIRRMPKSATLGTASSALKIADIFAGVPAEDRPRCIGWHPMNPVPNMDGGELIGTDLSSYEAIRRGHEFARQLGIEMVLLSDTSPGHVVNRILFGGMIRQAYLMLEDELVQQFSLTEPTIGPADLQTAMDNLDSAYEKSTNQPMGPFRLAKLVGLGVTLAICQSLTARRPADFPTVPSLLIAHANGTLFQKLAA